MPRLRIVAWEVRPIVMADDGENLTDVPVQPVRIPASAWEAFKDGGDQDALDQLRVQVEEPVHA